MVRSAFYSMAVGQLVALLAVLTGLADWSDIRADHPVRNWRRHTSCSTGWR
jgi:hypothetical protein